MSLTNSPFWFSSGATSAGGAFYPYSIDQSLRFNDDDSAYLSRTPSSASNRKTSTLSVWVKRSKLGADQIIFTVDAAANDANRMQFRFGSGDDLRLAGNFTTYLATNAKFRDVSSWYHIVLAIDTTQATASDRLSLYVNGEKITSLSASSYPSQNADLPWNLATLHGIGSDAGGVGSGSYFDGYMAEVNFIDGTALDATSFGETLNGVWVPKAYDTADGAYSTNGFYLDFSDNSTASALGTDSSGNGNNFSVSNLATTDQVLNSPTNNFPTLLPGFTQTTQEGGLKLKRSSSGNIHTGCFSTMGVSSGKWYVEIKYQDSGIDTVAFGVAGTEGGFDPSVDSTAYIATSGISSNVHVDYVAWSVEAKLSSSYANTLGSAGSYGSSPSSGDIIQIALDMDDKKIWYGVNGTYIASGDPANGNNPSQSGSSFNPTGEVVFVASAYMGRDFSISFNFGQDSTFAGLETAGGNADDNGIGDFKYAPPSGFLALCSANLPEATIGPNSDTISDENFNTVLYTGNGTAIGSGGNAITGVGFQPDWVWIKERNGSASHGLYDVVRGVTEQLESDTTAAETTESEGLTTFGTDGFTVGSLAQVNTNTDTYVAWNWKAGGTAVSNTDGSITSQVSAAPDAGISIVSWTGNATNPSTIGHGLSSAPEMIILKNRDSTGDWYIGHDGIGWTDRLKFTSGSTASSSTLWNNTAPTSSVFTISSALNFNGDATIAYCFHSVDGFSKVGSYIGNGSADGTFVYTGFRPAFILWKRTDGSVYFWGIKDTARSPYNVSNEVLFPNSSQAEGTNMSCDFLSNGFKWRSNQTSENASGATFIYLAFAEQPFKYANAR